MAALHGLRIDRVQLRATDASRSARYWSWLAGTGADGGFVLDRDGRPLLEFRDVGVAGPAPGRAAGLFHVALRFASRAALGAALERAGERGLRLTGASDHGVSEALYLRDPDGLGVELYWDRPREQWPQSIYSEPLDLTPLRAAAADDGAPVDVGHVHLSASDLDASTAFWRDRVGLDLRQADPQASFLSADGYHHHLAVNTWQTAGAAPAPFDRAGIERLVLEVDGRGDGVELDTPEGLLVAIGPRG